MLVLPSLIHDAACHSLFTWCVQHIDQVLETGGDFYASVESLLRAGFEGKTIAVVCVYRMPAACSFSDALEDVLYFRVSNHHE